VRDDARVREVYFGGGTTFAQGPVVLSAAKDLGAARKEEILRSAQDDSSSHA
jgi:hypothetical protein